METKNLVTMVVASVFIVLSVAVLVILFWDYRRSGKKMSDSLAIALYTGILCVAGVFWWKAYSEPRTGDLRVQCVGEEFADVVYETEASGASKPVKYKQREIACNEWRWEVRIEDRDGEYKWAPVLDK